MQDQSRVERIDALLDRAEITDCIHRYTRGMDRQDRALVRSAYHDDAVDDHVGFVGPVDEFLDWAFDYHAGQIRHQHYVTNHNIDLNGDEAHAESYFLFVATDRDPAMPLFMFGGRYVDRFERRGGRWAIAARVCLAEWQTHLASDLSPEAFNFMAVVGVVARDGSDVSYERPLVPKRVARA